MRDPGSGDGHVDTLQLGRSGFQRAYLHEPLYHSDRKG